MNDGRQTTMEDLIRAEYERKSKTEAACKKQREQHKLFYTARVRRRLRELHWAIDSGDKPRKQLLQLLANLQGEINS